MIRAMKKKNKSGLGDREGWDGGRDSILDSEMKEDLSENVTLEQDWK